MNVIEQKKVLYDISRLKPMTTVEAFDMHFNGVYKKHVEDFNTGNGDFAFNKAGAYLHGLFFENIREFRPDNLPSGKVSQVIETRYGTFHNFTETIFEQASRLQGNGWLFMNTAGYVNIIPNNRIVDNVGFVVDMWEHAYLPTHGLDKEKYLKMFLHCLNWEMVNKRILEPKKDQ